MSYPISNDVLAEFLLARTAEDEEVARKNTDGHGLGDDGSFPDYRTYDGPDIDAADEFIGHFTSARMLAECEAMRRIVEECHQVIRTHFSDDFMADYLAETVLKLLALPYSSHPDYRQEWGLSRENAG